MTSRRWTKEEDSILLKSYEGLSKNEILALLPQRTWDAIQQRAKGLFGLSRVSFKKHYGNTFAKGRRYVYKPNLSSRKINSFYISDRGYKYIKVKEASSSKNGWESYRPEHIVVMEAKIGRKILRTKHGKGEGVHHINGDKLDNNIENLVLYKDEKEHRSMHNSLLEVSFQLVKEGVIVFDPVTKTYCKKENNE